MASVMTDDRAEPTNPAESEAPVEPPSSAPSLDEEWAKKFAGLVSADLVEQLKPIHKHIQDEDVERGKLLRVLSELNDELKFIRIEVQASRKESATLHEKFANLADRVDRHQEILSDLRKTVGDHADRIVELERTGTEDER
jgi:predicted nuclease with TOPRIM domain